MKRSISRALASLVVGGAAALSASGMAQAGCNAIPNPDASFRGVVGRVNRPFAGAGEAEDVVELASACGSRSLTDVNGDGQIDGADFVVTVISKPPSSAPRNAVVLAGKGNCEALGPELGRLEQALGGRKPKCAAPGQNQLAVARQDGPPALSFRLPGTEFAGPATLVVTGVGEPLPVGLVANRCADNTPAHLFLCVDQLFNDDAGSCATSPADVDPVFTEFVVLPPINDYQRVCTEDTGLEPKCLQSAEKLFYTATASGDLMLHMRWDNILRKKAGGADLDRRAVLGSSAVEAFAGKGQPIAVPSAAFLGSFNPAGRSFDRKPLFIPAEGRPNESAFRGDADKERSVLRIARRLPWSYTCQGGGHAGQACEPYPDDHKDIVDCPEGTCGKRPPPRVFTCHGGSNDGKLCTRPHHCPGGGTCSVGSTCHTTSGAATGQACTTDADCPGSHECGPGLFEFRDRLTNGIGAIPRVAGGSFTGVCEDGLFEGTKCTGSSCLPLGIGRCVVFRAEAKEYLP